MKFKYISDFNKFILNEENVYRKIYPAEYKTKLYKEYLKLLDKDLSRTDLFFIRIYEVLDKKSQQWNYYFLFESPLLYLHTTINKNTLVEKRDGIYYYIDEDILDKIKENFENKDFKYFISAQAVANIISTLHLSENDPFVISIKDIRINDEKDKYYNSLSKLGIFIIEGMSTIHTLESKLFSDLKDKKYLKNYEIEKRSTLTDVNEIIIKKLQTLYTDLLVKNRTRMTYKFTYTIEEFLKLLLEDLNIDINIYYKDIYTLLLLTMDPVIRTSYIYKFKNLIEYIDSNTERQTILNKLKDKKIYKQKFISTRDFINELENVGFTPLQLNNYLPKILDLSSNKNDLNIVPNLLSKYMFRIKLQHYKFNYSKDDPTGKGIKLPKKDDVFDYKKLDKKENKDLIENNIKLLDLDIKEISSVVSVLYNQDLLRYIGVTQKGETNVEQTHIKRSDDVRGFEGLDVQKAFIILMSKLNSNTHEKFDEVKFIGNAYYINKKIKSDIKNKDVSKTETENKINNAYKKVIDYLKQIDSGLIQLDKKTKKVPKNIVKFTKQKSKLYATRNTLINIKNKLEKNPYLTHKRIDLISTYADPNLTNLPPDWAVYQNSIIKLDIIEKLVENKIENMKNYISDLKKYIFNIDLYKALKDKSLDTKEVQLAINDIINKDRAKKDEFIKELSNNIDNLEKFKIHIKSSIDDLYNQLDRVYSKLTTITPIQKFPELSKEAIAAIADDLLDKGATKEETKNLLASLKDFDLSKKSKGKGKGKIKSEDSTSIIKKDTQNDNVEDIFKDLYK